MSRVASVTFNLTACLAIPTYRREGVLVDTLRQALALERPADEILVIDQTPDAEHEPATLGFLREQSASGRIRWIRQFPANLPAARNRALRESSCDIVIFIDDDVILSPNFVAAHLANYFDPRVVAVAGQVLGPDRKTVGVLPARVRGRRFGWLAFPLNYDKRALVAVAPGGNCSVRRDVALAIGGFDPAYTGSALREEHDFFIRLRDTQRAVGLCVFDPQASLVHIGCQTGGCAKRASTLSVSDVANETYFWLKNFEPHEAAIMLLRTYAWWLRKLPHRLKHLVAIAAGAASGLARCLRTGRRGHILS